MPFGAHPAIGQNLRNGILRGWGLFCLIGFTQGPDIIHRVEIADILQRVSDAVDQIGVADNDSHSGP